MKILVLVLMSATTVLGIVGVTMSIYGALRRLWRP